MGSTHFYDCSALTQINIPDGVTSIGEWAFAGCSALTQINIPEGVTSIGKYAFYGCSALTQVNIPKSWTSICNGLFENCSSLTQVNIPDGVTNIGMSAFSGCSALTQINIPEGVTSIGKYAFSGCSALTQVNIPKSWTSICNGLFENCSSLTQINIPDGVTNIGEYAFYGCSALTQINIPNGVTSIGEWAFAGCSSLTEITIPTIVQCINSGLCENCSNLKRVIASPTHIGRCAFMNCPLLSEINFDSNIVSIDRDAFRGCTSLTEFSIPSGVKTIEPSILWECPNIKRLSFGKNLSGLPFKKHFSDIIFYTTEYASFQSVSYGNDEYLDSKCFFEGLKEVIIEDSETPFSMKGNRYDYKRTYEIPGRGPEHVHSFMISPAFVWPTLSITELDYFYVGRTLVDIKEWQADDDTSVFSITDNNRPIGHIKTLEISGNCSENPYFYQSVDTLILGANISLFIPENIYLDGLKKVVCHSATPPSIKDVQYMVLPEDAKLYIPVGTLDAYKSADGWKNFWNIEECDFSGVEAIEGDKALSCVADNGILRIENKNENSIVRIYNIQGAMVAETSDDVVNNLPDGLYIVTVENKSFKVSLR